MTDRVINESSKRITQAYGGHNGVDLGYRVNEEENKVIVKLSGNIIFLQLPQLIDIFEHLPKDKDIYVYEDLSCYSKNMTFKLLKNKNIFEKGVMYYNNRDYDKSLLYFQEILKSLPEDNASYIYYNKTKEKLSLKS